MIETFTMLLNINISDKYCSSELSIQRNLKNYTQLLNNNMNNACFWAANLNIITADEGSCDTEHKRTNNLYRSITIWNPIIDKKIIINQLMASKRSLPTDIFVSW